MNRYHIAYYQAFVGSLLLCWSPFKMLAYLAPFSALVWFILATRSSLVVRNTVLWLSAWTLSILLHAPFVRDYAFHSALLSVVTYGSFAMIVAIPTHWLADSKLVERMLYWVRRLALVQALWGLVQAGYGYMRTGSLDISNGDYVEGTIHPALGVEGAFANPMFATNMTFLLLALLPDVLLKKRSRAPFFLGLVALAAASVIHVLLILAASLVIAALIYRPMVLKHRTGCLLVAGLMLLAVLAYGSMPTNFGNLPGFARGMIQGKYPRATVTVDAVTEMPHEYPLMPLFGLGPGQFSSRAGLIGTGLYFGTPVNPRPLPLMPQGMSAAFRDYVLDIWLEMSFSSGRGYGSTHKPHYSWLSMYTEMGGVMLLLIFLAVGKILHRVKTAARTYPRRVEAVALGTGILLVLMLGIQENYWEVSQALFPGLLLLKVLYANVVHRSRSDNILTNNLSIVSMQVIDI